MNDIYNQCKNEETASGDIAFAPQMGFSAPSKEDKELLKDKSKKKEKLSQQQARLKREQEVKEAVEQSIVTLKEDIGNELLKITKQSRLTASSFITVFKGVRDITPAMYAIRLLRPIQSVRELKKKLPDDIGELELTMSALRNRKTIAVYEPFDSMMGICGAKIASIVDGVGMVYQGAVDLNYAEQETLYIGDMDKAAEIASGLGAVKVSGKTIYPHGGVFNPRMFTIIKDILMTDERSGHANAIK
jgi:hypothetical protein